MAPIEEAPIANQSSNPQPVLKSKTRVRHPYTAEETFIGHLTCLPTLVVLHAPMGTGAPLLILRRKENTSINEHQPAFKLTLIGSLSIVHAEDFSKFFSAAVKEKLGFFYRWVWSPYFLVTSTGVAVESRVP
jgi:hypothetical protein